MQPRLKTLARIRLEQWTVNLAVLLLAMTAHAADTKYFVAVDNLEVLTSGTHAGLPNPNFGRLTFLFAHTDAGDPSSNHFHAIGAYSYTGSADDPVVISTNTNNRIPELFTGELPLRLLPGTEAFADKLVSRSTGEEYSHLKIESIQTLGTFPSDSPEGILFNSSEGRWATPLDGAVVALQLVSITPKLHIANEAGQPLPPNRSPYRLGDGNTLMFLPAFWTENTTPVGTYSVTFKLVDIRESGTPLGDSGRFTFDFRVPKFGDLDGDNDVDGDDAQILFEALDSPTTGPYDPRDLNADGSIDQADFHILFDLL